VFQEQTNPEPDLAVLDAVTPQLTSQEMSAMVDVVASIVAQATSEFCSLQQRCETNQLRAETYRKRLENERLAFRNESQAIHDGHLGVKEKLERAQAHLNELRTIAETAIKQYQEARLENEAAKVRAVSAEARAAKAEKRLAMLLSVGGMLTSKSKHEQEVLLGDSVS
jgi:hypothetical protein